MQKAVSRKSHPKKRTGVIQKERLRRSHRITLILNDKENEALDSYCKKYKIEGKVKFIRETVFRHIMDRFLADYPTLFEEETMQSLVVNEPYQYKLF